MSYLRELPFDEKDFPTLQLLKEEYGFIPNFFKAQTARPDLIDAEVQLVDAILIRKARSHASGKNTSSWFVRRRISARIV